MKVPNTDDNLVQCNCPNCPTYVQGDKVLFCATGKSVRSLIKKGCRCPQCPLWPEYKLSSTYFCFGGAAT
jgi:hypothetical protein